MIALLVVGVLAWLLLRYGLPRANSLKEAVPVYLAAVVLAGFFFVNALLAYSQASEMEAEATLQPLGALNEVMEHLGEEQILITGRIGSEMSPALADYVAYVDLDESGFDWLPALIVELEDRQPLDVNDGYEPANWPQDGTYRVLKAADPVVVLGEPYGTVTSLAAGEAVNGAGINPQLVFYGSYDTYVSDYLPTQNWQVTWNLFLAALCLFLAALMFVLPLPRLYRLWRKQVDKKGNG